MSASVLLAETMGQAAEGSGSSRLPFDGYGNVRIRRVAWSMVEERYPACEASARSVGRVAEGVPPEQATANSGPGQDPGRTSATTFLTWPSVVHVGAVGADIAIRAEDALRDFSSPASRLAGIATTSMR